MNLELIHLSGNKPLTTSRLVAEKFGKNHDFVLRKIENLACSKQFHSANFTESKYIDSRGKHQKSYELTEEGFMFIAMRFTGKEAVQWQEKFIIAFQKMRNELLRQKEMRLSIDWKEARANGKCIRLNLGKAIGALSTIADKQGGKKDRKYYSSVTRMVYKALFDDSSLKDVRDKSDILQLTFLSICEEACAAEIDKLVSLGVDYHIIFSECKKRVVATVDGLSMSKLKGADSPVKLVWEKTNV